MKTDVMGDVFICLTEKIYPTGYSQAQKRIIRKKAMSLKLMMVNSIICMK